LCEYAVATGSDEDMSLIRDGYDAIERNTLDMDFKDIFHGTWSPVFKRHGLPMFGVHMANLARPVLGDERVQRLSDYCLDQSLNVFAKDEHRLLFESLGRDGNVVDNDEGRVINPGHTMEAMWFCIEEGLHRGDRSIVDRALEIVDWAWDAGYDREHGGIVAFLDASGKEPRQMDWHKQTNMQWHDKPWWVHSEALYALALAAIEWDSQEHFDRFLDLHEWCQRYFYDAQYGEWYPELYRDGTPKLTDKGTLWKAAYHLPRALMKIMLLLDRSAQ